MKQQSASPISHPLLHLVTDRDFLESLASEFRTPLYVYDGTRLQENVIRLDQAISESFKNYIICYALKANNNPHLVALMKSVVPTLGADCSSPGELTIAKKVGIPPKSCIYTGNYESTRELRLALESGVHLNLDDTNSYERLKTVGLPDEISFRLNPGFGKGTFPAIVTGGKEAKFGILKENIVEAYRKAKQDGISQFGIQSMPGSGNLETDYFIQLIQVILDTARSIENELSIEFSFISMGGGLGIPYEKDDRPLAVEGLFQELSQVFAKYYDNSPDSPRLVVEPGKYLVGDAGFLLSRVVGKKRGYKNFIGLDAGMNTFIRPALYSAYHKIYKVGDLNEPPALNVDFTGKICENTDRLAVDRPFPEVKEGDLIAIMDTGAYGFVMASQYNTRPRPAEILVIDGEPKLIRQKETIEDIFRLCNWDEGDSSDNQANQ